MRPILLAVIGFGYRFLIKPLLFLQNPEAVHLRATKIGTLLGNSSTARTFLSWIFGAKTPALEQRLFGITFESPIGLAAGFDYEAKLTYILPSLGFGFGTAGTLTNLPYEGNARPMLGRLPHSKSLLVNKGFKNLGVAATLRSLESLPQTYPVGISIGKTNIETIITQAQGVADIVAAFKTAEASPVNFSYYELNISCPNLKGSVEFYEPAHLEELLAALEPLNLKKPVWVKMPISKSDEEITAILEVITRHPFISAIVFGNLQRDRATNTFDQQEIAACGKGNFSGLPCQARSDELIALAYKKCGQKIRIIGCGGVFSAADAYRKITLGASLVQLITGMIYEGPQLVAQINQQLPQLLARDGFTSIHQAIGSKNH